MKRAVLRRPRKIQTSTVDVDHPAFLDVDHCIVKILNLQLVMKSAVDIHHGTFLGRR